MSFTSSVIKIHTKTPGMGIFTCGMYEMSRDGGATATWGSTAIQTRRSSCQHWFPWANGVVYRDTSTSGTKIATVGCDRDEWPPRYFWPGDAPAAKMKPALVQRIRFIPSEENRAAGQVWKQFCNNRGAKSTFVKDKKPTTYRVSEHIHTTKSETRSEVDKKKPPTTSMLLGDTNIMFTCYPYHLY